MAGSDKILGIDLGTTNSVMAVIEGDRPLVIPNAEGQNKTPSVVSFLPSGEVIVGEIARRQAATNVDGTVFSIKRLMGRHPDELGDDLDFFVQPITADEGHVVLDIGGRGFTPSQLSAMILSKMKSDAEMHLGETIERAVITVPAYFDDRQRQATKEAGRAAGLDVLRIINEPTAAAMAYGLNQEGEERIAVFDFGGGTFDLSILDISQGAFEVVTSLGDSHLGGDDIDHAIVDMLLEEFEKQTGVDIGADDLAIRRLKEAAEKAKCELSGTSSTLISLPFIGQSPDGQPLHMDYTVARDQIEDLIEPFVSRCLECCQQALTDAGIGVRDIAKVILVGGSTRIPIVQAAVEDFFGIEPHRGVNPDEIVAMGAAVQGGVMSGALEEVVLLEVTPFSLGIETKDNTFTKIIEKNATIPLKAAKIFTTTEDNQLLVNIHVLQGEASSANEATSLGQFSLIDIPSAKARSPRIRVTFQINADGMVEIEAEHMGSGQAESLTIVHSFDERGAVAVIDSENGAAQPRKRPNRWRDRRKRRHGNEGYAEESLTGVPLNARAPLMDGDRCVQEVDIERSNTKTGVDFAAPPGMDIPLPLRTGEADCTQRIATPSGEEAETIVESAKTLLSQRANSSTARSVYRSAIVVIERILVSGPADSRLLLLLGELHLQTQNLSKARAAFERHIEAHPTMLAEVRECYDRHIEVNSQSVEARIDRARLLALLGELDEAVASLEALEGPEGRTPAVTEALISLLRQRLTKSPDSTTEFKIVKLHLQQNDLDEAITILQRLVNHHSFAERAGKVLGLCFWQKHMHYLAWQRFRQLPLDDEMKDILYRLSVDMEGAEDLINARQVLEHLSKADPNYRDTEERLSSVRAKVKAAREQQQPSESDAMGLIASPESQIDDVRFSIFGEINRGSMGVIYKAKDNVLDEIVAIKVLNAFLSADPQAVQRFKREARNAKRLSHPNIVRIHDMFEKGTKKFLSMEFIDGSDLKSILKTHGRLSSQEVIRIAAEICKALSYAHRLDIIHRDIKPANIMITQGTKAVKITDFGIAKCLSATDRSGTGTMVMGTPLYMAPEQVEGRDVDGRTDIYSLGVMMYELSSGAPPFTDGNIEYHHVHTEPKPPEKCIPALTDIIMRCLSKSLANRFQSADELCAQLNGLALRSTETGGSPVS